MDENKENLTPAAETEEILTETDTDNTEVQPEAEPETALEDAPADETGEAAPEAELEAAPEAGAEEEIIPVPEKKKGKLNKTIIISAVIVCVVVVAALLVRLFFFQGLVKTDFFGNKTNTVWHYGVDMPYYDESATGDEAIKTRTIDCFYEFNGDGTMTCKIGSVETKGTYALKYLEKDEAGDNKEAQKKIGTPVCQIKLFDPLTNYPLDGTYYYEVNGNAFTGRKAKLTNILSNQYVLDFDEKAYDAPQFKREGEFKKDDKVVGSWTYKNESISETFTFNADGTFSVSDVTEMYRISQAGIYDCDNGTIKIKTKFVEEQESDLKYKVEGNSFVVTREIEGQSTDIKYEKN